MKATLVSLLLASTALFAAATKNVDRTLPLRATGSVTLETHNGTVEVRTWDRAEIEIHARIEAAGSSSEDMRRFDQTNVRIDNTSDSVRIKSVYPDFTWNWSWSGSGGNPSIHYTINSPRTARWSISDHNGKVDIAGLDAALSVSSHNGTTNVSRLGGPLELEMHNGTVNADITRFQGAHISMHNGDVELAMPSSSKFDLRTESHSTGIQSDFPLLTRAMGRHNSNFQGSVNGGGPELRINSHNGHVRLRAK